MTAAPRAEWRKARTVRSTWLLLGGVIAVELAFKGLFAALQPVEEFDRAGQYRLLGPTLFLSLAAAVLGVLIAGQEWRYRLAVPTYLAIPARAHVLLAKTIVAGVLAMSTGLVATGASNALCGLVFNARLTPLVPFAMGWRSSPGARSPRGCLPPAGWRSARSCARRSPRSAPQRSCCSCSPR